MRTVSDPRFRAILENVTYGIVTIDDPPSVPPSAVVLRPVLRSLASLPILPQPGFAAHPPQPGFAARPPQCYGGWKGYAGGSCHGGWKDGP